MNADPIFRELEEWIERLWAACNEVKTDQLTRGPDAWAKNRACQSHQFLMEASAVEGLRLLREARQIAVDRPTPKNTYALAKCERLIRQWLASEPDEGLMPDEQHAALLKFEARLRKDPATH